MIETASVPAKILFASQHEDIETIISNEMYVDVIQIPVKKSSSVVSVYAECKSGSRPGSSLSLKKPNVVNSRPSSAQSMKKPTQIDSKTSLKQQSSAIPKMILPHAPGTLPSYLKKRKQDVSRPTTPEVKPTTTPLRVPKLRSSTTETNMWKRPTQSSMTSIKTPKKVEVDESSGDSNTISQVEADTLRKQVSMMATKNTKLMTQVSDLNRSMEKMKKEVEAAAKIAEAKDIELREKSEKLAKLDQKIGKLQREQIKVDITDKKAQQFDAENEKLKSSNEELSDKLAAQEDEAKRLKVKVRDLQKDLKLKSDAADGFEKKLKTIEASKDLDGKASSQREDELAKLRNHVAICEMELKSMKDDSHRLNNENKSLKTQSLDLLHTKSAKAEQVEIQSLKRQIVDLKTKQYESERSLNAIKSSLDDEVNKNERQEGLLQLRGDYIKTLQETVEVGKARIMLHMQENEYLQKEIKKLSAFDSSKKEEHENLISTLNEQNREISKLENALERMTAKVEKYKKQLHAAN